jgi:hypothetical protein
VSRPHDVACVVHLHSTYSDGTATVAEIAGSAARTGVEVVLLTDHDTLAARRAGEEGWYGDVLVVVGQEVTPSGGHLLAFGLDEEVIHAGLDERAIARRVAAAGGLGFAAHAFSAGSSISLRVARAHGWPALDEPSLTGMELWSLETDGLERCASLREAARMLWDPARALRMGPREGALATWDRLSATRRLPAIGGLDAHQKPGVRVRGRMRGPLAGDRVFGLLQTRVLLDAPLPRDAAAAATAVHEALAAGRAYIAAEGLAPAGGVAFWAEPQDPEGSAVPMGGEAPAGAYTLRARLPRAAELTLVADGAPVRTVHADALDHAVSEAGVFRLEARLDGYAWILTNPVHLR